eukprot:2376094-Amphidinium_carterae.1
MVFGPDYVPFLPRFIHRAFALGLTNLVIFCLDAAAYSSCIEASDINHCVRGTPSILNKFTLPLVYLHLQVDVFWLDFDTFLFKDPTPRVLQLAAEKKADLLVSGSFADDCICSGIVFFRATARVAAWLLTMTSWMYENVHSHDQQAFSAFLGWREDVDNVTRPEKISSLTVFIRYMRPVVPRWALLDPVNEFVSAHVLNTTGWTGDAQDVFIFHFLHGGSELNGQHSANSWIEDHQFVNLSRSLMDVFYNQSGEATKIYESGQQQPAFEQSSQIRQALLASRRPARPSPLLHCGPYTLLDRADRERQRN